MELNLRPAVYKTAALPTELQVLKSCGLPSKLRSFTSFESVLLASASMRNLFTGSMGASPFSTRKLTVTP